MKNAFLILVAIIAIAIVAVVSGAVYTVKETDQVIITQFGKPVGDPVTEAGLHFKTPFIQEVNRIDKRVLRWDGRPSEIPTKDKTYIVVNSFGRWRISDPLQYYIRLRDERRAQSRLDDILGSATRSAIAKRDLIEVVRTTKGREPERDEIIADAPGSIGELPPIEAGRAVIEQEILETAAAKLADFGIELLDVRFKRINYNNQVRDSIYQRMISERKQIASLFRSQGEGEAAKIQGRLERDLQEIESIAYREVQEIRGKADAQATQIYADAYGQSSASAAYYEFTKTLDAYKAMLGKDTTMVLTSDSDLFKFMKSINPEEQ